MTSGPYFPPTADYTMIVMIVLTGSPYLRYGFKGPFGTCGGAHLIIPPLQKLRQEDLKFEAS